MSRTIYERDSVSFLCPSVCGYVDGSHQLQIRICAIDATFYQSTEYVFYTRFGGLVVPTNSILYGKEYMTQMFLSNMHTIS